MRPTRVFAALVLVLVASCRPSLEPRTAVRGEPASALEPAAPCVGFGADGGCVLWNPSLRELIDERDAYHGRRVRVTGYVNFEFEGNGLYVSRDDWQHRRYANGVWINPPRGFESGSGPAPDSPNRRFVLVEATFRADRRGHFSLWSGSLQDVTRIEPRDSLPG